MRYTFFALSTCLILGLVSCSKDNPVELKSPDTDEFVTCECTIPAGKTAPEEYIKATVNGVQLCADVKRVYPEDFDNRLKYGLIKRSTGNSYYDNLGMIRFTKDGRFMLAIFMENTHLLTKQFPYKLPRPNPEYCEIGELQIQNELKITPIMCHTCADNYWHYLGSFYQDQLSYTADRYEHGYLEGHFEGMIHTGSGKYASVKNGMFRIKLTEQYTDVIVP